jgi:hypothetical protein
MPLETTAEAAAARAAPLKMGLSAARAEARQATAAAAEAAQVTIQALTLQRELPDPLLEAMEAMALPEQVAARAAMPRLVRLVLLALAVVEEAETILLLELMAAPEAARPMAAAVVGEAETTTRPRLRQHTAAMAGTSAAEAAAACCKAMAGTA